MYFMNDITCWNIKFKMVKRKNKFKTNNPKCHKLIFNFFSCLFFVQSVCEFHIKTESSFSKKKKKTISLYICFSFFHFFSAPRSIHNWCLRGKYSIQIKLFQLTDFSYFLKIENSPNPTTTHYTTIYIRQRQFKQFYGFCGFNNKIFILQHTKSHITLYYPHFTMTNRWTFSQNELLNQYLPIYL